MKDADVLREQSKQSHEWLLANGRIPLDCGVRVYRTTPNSPTGDVQYRGVCLFSGDLDLWWMVPFHRDGNFGFDSKRWTKLALCGPTFPIYTNTERGITIEHHLAADINGFLDLSIDPKRLADLLVAYLSRAAGNAHRQMKRYCFDLSNLTRWESDQGEDAGRKMVHCYLAIARVKASPLWQSPRQFQH